MYSKMRKLVGFSLVLLFLVLFGFSKKTFAAYTICEYGDRYCKNSTLRCYCNSSYTWTCTYCLYGCVNGYCKIAPVIDCSSRG